MAHVFNELGKGRQRLRTQQAAGALEVRRPGVSFSSSAPPAMARWPVTDRQAYSSTSLTV
jgi:hypothetical protein